jgi:hypothetical protein
MGLTTLLAVEAARAVRRPAPAPEGA